MELSKTYSKVYMKFMKHSPELLIISGVAGVVTAAVLACKETIKVHEIVNKAKTDIETVRANSKSKDEEKNKVTKIALKTSGNVIKAYAPALAIGTLSIMSIFASNQTLRKRNASLAAAYAALDKGFKEYRHRVIERFGDELEKEIRYNIQKEVVQETEVDKDGKKKKVKSEKSYISEISTCSPYAKFYDDGCIGWDKNPEYNLMFLRQQQAHANDLLRLKGFLFLNDVYKMLGIPETKAGQIVGWIYDENNPVGDNYIDFGIYNMNKVKNRDFVNGYERTILLDFNVDGNILDLM